jgi:alkylhydroperoxidase family enzyme
MNDRGHWYREAARARRFADAAAIIPKTATVIEATAMLAEYGFTPEQAIEAAFEAKRIQAAAPADPFEGLV